MAVILRSSRSRSWGGSGGWAVLGAASSRSVLLSMPIWVTQINLWAIYCRAGLTAILFCSTGRGGRSSLPNGLVRCRRVRISHGVTGPSCFHRACRFRTALPISTCTYFWHSFKFKVRVVR